MKDVGYAEIGAETYSTDLNYNGADAIGVGVQQLSNANALAVDRGAKAALDELAKSFPPGMKYAIPFDTTTVVGDSIREVRGYAGRSNHHRHRRDLSLFARLARDHHPRDHHPGVADRYVCIHQDIWLFDQFADHVRHHAGHRPGGG